MPHKDTTESFIKKSIEKFGDIIDYSQVDYKNNRTAVVFLCPKHGKFSQKPNAHLNGKHPCPKCSKNIPTNDEFISKAKDIHYNISFEKTKYIKDNKKVIVTCNKHGDFFSLPNSLLTGKGCAKCANNNNQNNLYFINKAKEYHGDKYNYSLARYKNNYTKVIIICNTHGEFKQSPANHYKYGCLNCSGKCRKNTDDFINQANIIHNNSYDYSLVEYKNAYSKIIIICNTHGNWETDPSNHLAGKRCPKCSIRISKKEIQWLDYLGIPNENRNIYININNKKFFADGYDPITKTVYEFYGDYWHGNPAVYNQDIMNIVTKKTFGELYNKTINKEKVLIKAGYNIISIWENDWNKLQGT